MSLNSNQMLPARLRNMRQMKELLSVEDIVLADFEHSIEEMYHRNHMYREVLVNEPWLEGKLGEITGGIAAVQKHENILCIDISINVSQLPKEQEEKVTAFIGRWLPAHLAYEITYENILCGYNYFAALWQDDDITILRQVEI